MKKKVYISLPITGREPKDVYAQANDAASRLTLLGYEAISPLDNGLPWDAPHYQHMRKDIETLLNCDAIYFCKDYIESNGCMVEKLIAHEIGIPSVYHFLDNKHIKEIIE